MMKLNASIKCVTYGGRIGWGLRRYFSKYTSYLYLKFQYLLRLRLFKRYIAWFEKQNHMPLFCLISIETINRCNSSCEFCPANKNADTRPFMQMDQALFEKIISELEELNYSGYVNLYVNNEPFMDKRIADWYKYAKENLPKAKMLLYTNGTLLTKPLFDKIIPYVDKMIINNYSENLKLHKNIYELYEEIKNNPQYKDKDITIQLRYIKEILANRAGYAPNKAYKDNNNELCIMPYTDFTIFPDGTVGICCCDAKEKTNLGNVSHQSLKTIWESEKYKILRQKLKSGRNNYAFCKGCDFIDAGIRNIFMKKVLVNAEESEDATK